MNKRFLTAALGGGFTFALYHGYAYVNGPAAGPDDPGGGRRVFRRKKRKSSEPGPGGG